MRSKSPKKVKWQRSLLAMSIAIALLAVPSQAADSYCAACTGQAGNPTHGAGSQMGNVNSGGNDWSTFPNCMDISGTPALAVGQSPITFNAAKVQCELNQSFRLEIDPDNNLAAGVAAGWWNSMDWFYEDTTAGKPVSTL